MTKPLLKEDIEAIQALGEGANKCTYANKHLDSIIPYKDYNLRLMGHQTAWDIEDNLDHALQLLLRGLIEDVIGEAKAEEFYSNDELQDYITDARDSLIQSYLNITRTVEIIMAEDGRVDYNYPEN